MILKSNPKAIDNAAKTLEDGGVVVFPTETVYGLGGDATNDLAVAKVYKIKNRPIFNPLIAHFYDIEQLKKYVELPPVANDIARAFWPGPLTLVLKRKENSPLSLLASTGLDSIGVRIPNHPTALAIIKAFGRPIVAPSANISARISPTSAYDAEAALENQSLLILDGGKCEIGIESTIVDLSCDNVTILRPGAITAKDLSRFININDAVSFTIKAPGQMSRHYSPCSKMRLNATCLYSEEALLAFGDTDKILPADTKYTCLNLSKSYSLNEAAANLFAMMRGLDQLVPSAIAVMPIPNEGIGLAINDRLTRAANYDWEARLGKKP
ncbi:MAG: threonylcarbamoyl-AMP synthase [Holosporales bacterium]|nr:threonylcarbamoyl-AMP synthase [Holosporales bacterium]